MKLARWQVAGLLWMIWPAWAGDYDATVDWARRVELASPVAGVVAQVSAEPGQQVAAGQVLVALESQPFEAALEAARARVARRQREHLEALRAWRRAKELYEGQVLSTVERDQARLALTQAKAELDAARADLKAAAYRFEHSRLKAPFEAVVLARRAEVGQAVTAELAPEVLVVVAEAGRYLARFQIAAGDLDRIQAGRPARVTVAGKTYPGVVREVGLEPAGSGSPRSYPVAVVFEADRLLRAGLPAQVTLR